ncbi:MAG TPA: hypothetical protein DCM86_13280, partial [Verrucomicrobiales bacterium]|nr:hypothetical protein [Verrucomicrobiales bacterium]
AQTWLAAGAPVGVTNDRPTVAIDRLPPSTTRVYRLATPPALGAADVPPPVILESPFSQSVEEGNPVTLEVQASGVPDLSYQWFKNNVAIPQATAATLPIAAATAADGGVYSVVVIDGNGSPTTSKEALLKVLQRPVITQQPKGALLNAGQTLLLSVKATGVGALSYRWALNDHFIPGANQSTYTVPSVTGANSGTYRVVVTAVTPNGPLSRSSDSAQVLVNE